MNSAYLQARRLKQDIFVRPPPNDIDNAGIWNFLVPPYGLTDSSRLWYLTSNEVLTRQYGLEKYKLDPSKYLRKRQSDNLLLVIRVVDYLYVGDSRLASKLEKHFCKHFQIGSMERAWSAYRVGAWLKKSLERSKLMQENSWRG